MAVAQRIDNASYHAVRDVNTGTSGPGGDGVAEADAAGCIERHGENCGAVEADDLAFNFIALRGRG